MVYYWQYRVKGQSIEQNRKTKSGKENAFHIEESPKPDGLYDKDTWQRPDIRTTDVISSVAASQDSFIIGLTNGQVIKYSLPYIAMESKMNLRCRP